MPFKIFNIAVPNDGREEEELNRFLLTHRVLTVQAQWVTRGEVPYQVFTVEYAAGKAAQAGLATPPPSQADARVDYQKLLPPAAFEKFCRLREERRRISEAEAVKPFVVFTNAQLAAMAQLETVTLETLRAIEGVGEARMEKYGKTMVAVLSEEKREAAE